MKGYRWSRKRLFAFDIDHTVIRAAKRRANFVGEAFRAGGEKQVKEMSGVSIAVGYSGWTVYDLVQVVR